MQKHTCKQHTVTNNPGFGIECYMLLLLPFYNHYIGLFPRESLINFSGHQFSFFPHKTICNFLSQLFYILNYCWYVFLRSSCSRTLDECFIKSRGSEFKNSIFFCAAHDFLIIELQHCLYCTFHIKFFNRVHHLWKWPFVYVCLQHCTQTKRPIKAHQIWHQHWRIGWKEVSIAVNCPALKLIAG